MLAEILSKVHDPLVSRAVQFLNLAESNDWLKSRQLTIEMFVCYRRLNILDDSSLLQDAITVNEPKHLTTAIQSLIKELAEITPCTAQFEEAEQLLTCSQIKRTHQPKHHFNPNANFYDKSKNIIGKMIVWIKKKRIKKRLKKMARII